MAIDAWISFLLASALLCFSPGPTVLLVLGKSLNHGKGSVIPLVAGVLSGDVIAMAISFVGLGALLATYAVLFGIFKWVAAAYLIYIGIKAWRTQLSDEHTDLAMSNSGSVFKEALVVTALNPKGIIFFIAFFLCSSIPLSR
ncbi:LysE family translocator [Simiduia curdlanivorans]|uniref:LysE family translocator n=1 Tax=Simiduia curdlanivorans TaxID=1492769 RepID=A0ABV8V490_9GAMM|nr:LysE family translocator [Simiduia curdlanivorans]MDN3640945.1 LysE family translocator [Simiduia curdlanivorans]